MGLRMGEAMNPKTLPVANGAFQAWTEKSELGEEPTLCRHAAGLEVGLSTSQEARSRFLVVTEYGSRPKKKGYTLASQMIQKVRANGEK